MEKKDTFTMKNLELSRRLADLIESGQQQETSERSFLEDFVKHITESTYFQHETKGGKSEAGIAVEGLLGMARNCGHWPQDEKKTPLSVRRERRKNGESLGDEPAWLTILCRLEGKVRDRFRAPKEESKKGKVSKRDADKAETSEPKPAETLEQEKRKFRNEGKLIVLLALKTWTESRKTISKKALLGEIQRMEEGLSQQG